MTSIEMSIPNRLTQSTNKISLRTASLVAGIGLLIMAIAAPFAELYAYPRLVVPGDAAETTKNILANPTLFSSAILGYLVAFLCDVLVAWGLYVFLKPVDENFSLLTAWFRLVYTVIAVVALLNVVTVAEILNAADALSASQLGSLQAQVMLSIHAFKSHWYFGLLFFGIHLVLLGYLVFRSTYIPKIIGALLVIAGLGYLLNALKPFLFPNVNLDFAQYTFYGELIFMLWLLIKGPRVKEFQVENLK